MIHTASAMKARQNLGELLTGVQYRHDSVLITKAGRPVAALVDVELFQKIRNMSDLFDTLSTELAGAYQHTSVKIAHEEIKAALKTTRKKKK